MGSYVKNSAQAAILGLPIGAPIPTYAPSNQTPQATVDRWRGVDLSSGNALADQLNTGGFLYEFRPGGPNDFKLISPIYDAYGNTLFGAAGAAASLSGADLQMFGDLAHGGLITQ